MTMTYEDMTTAIEVADGIQRRSASPVPHLQLPSTSINSTNLILLLHSQFSQSTMRPFIVILALLPTILALQANLAGLVDWHKPLLGQPLLEPSPPSIVETRAGRRILAITQKNVFGALNEDGEVVWRQQMDESDPVVSYHVDGECEYSPGARGSG